MLFAASQVNIAGWDTKEACTLPQISLKQSKDESSSMATPTSTLIVSGFTHSSNMYSGYSGQDTLDQKTDISSRSAGRCIM